MSIPPPQKGRRSPPPTGGGGGLDKGGAGGSCRTPPCHRRPVTAHECSAASQQGGKESIRCFMGLVRTARGIVSVQFWDFSVFLARGGGVLVYKMGFRWQTCAKPAAVVESPRRLTVLDAERTRLAGDQRRSRSGSALLREAATASDKVLGREGRPWG